MSLDLTSGDRGPSFRDPYGVCLKSKRRDIGPYKDLFAIEASSIDFKKKTNASLLLRRLKYALIIFYDAIFLIILREMNFYIDCLLKHSGYSLRNWPLST